MAQEDVKRVSVNFSLSAYEDLQKLANMEGVSVSEALRNAIALSRWFIETRQSGATILIKQNGKIDEIVKFQ